MSSAKVENGYENGECFDDIHYTYHIECREEPKYMPYISITKENGKSVYDLRHELNALLFWRDSNKSFVSSLKERTEYDLKCLRIEEIKSLIY